LSYYAHAKAFLREDFDTAQVYHDRSLQLSPNYAHGWMLASANKAYIGLGAEAVAYAERALELSPIDLDMFQYFAFLAFAKFANRDFEAAVSWAERSRSENAHYTSNLKLMTGALAALDRLEEARRVAKDLLALEPEYRVSSYEGTRRPFRDADLQVTMMNALRRAGIPY
jgi:adenylate cyclase